MRVAATFEGVVCATAAAPDVQSAPVVIFNAAMAACISATADICLACVVDARVSVSVAKTSAWTSALHAAATAWVCGRLGSCTLWVDALVRNAANTASLASVSPFVCAAAALSAAIAAGSTPAAGLGASTDLFFTCLMGALDPSSIRSGIPRAGMYSVTWI